MFFFFRLELGIEQLVMTDWLSPSKTLVSETGTPNILNLYRMSMTCSTASLPATLSAPYVADSTVFCIFEVQRKFVQFNIKTIRHTDLLGTRQGMARVVYTRNIHRLHPRHRHAERNILTSSWIYFSHDTLWAEISPCHPKVHPIYSWVPTAPSNRGYRWPKKK